VSARASWFWLIGQCSMNRVSRRSETPLARSGTGRTRAGKVAEIRNVILCLYCVQKTLRSRTRPRVPDAPQHEAKRNDAALSRDPPAEPQLAFCGSRFCSAPFHVALRAGHECRNFPNRAMWRLSAGAIPGVHPVPASWPNPDEIWHGVALRPRVPLVPNTPGPP